MPAPSRLELVRRLAQRMRVIEKRGDIGAARTAGTAVARWQSEMDWETWLPSERSVVEWLADGPGCGAQTLALALLGRSLPEAGTIVIIDPRREFYPPAAAALGIDPAQTIVVRPADEAAALWALEQTLRSRGVHAAFCRLGAINDRASRRLQLAVEHGGGRGVLVRPAYFQRQPSWADARLLVRPVRTYGARPDQPAVGARTRLNVRQFSTLSTRKLHIELLSLRGGVPGGVCEVELCHETGGVRLVAQLARAASPVRAAGA